jgi:hypothetical protein
MTSILCHKKYTNRVIVGMEGVHDFSKPELEKKCIRTYSLHIVITCRFGPALSETFKT